MYIKRKLLTLLVCSFAAVFCMNYHLGPGTSGGQFQTGAPFDGGTCASCHGGGSFTPSTTVQLLSGTTPVTSYVPGGSYTVRITMTGSTRFGFQIVCVNASNGDYNGWGTLPATTHMAVSGASRHYVEHSNTLTSGVIDIPWTAPLSGQIKFYACGNIVDATGSTGGDNVAATTLFLNPCSAPVVTPTPTNELCFGGNTGAVSLAVTGTGPFTYAWTGPGGFTSTNQNITGLIAGSYSVVVSASGCSANANATVTQPPAVTSLASSNAPFCPGDTLMFVGVGSGGTGTLTYSWSGPGGFSSTLQSPQILNATPAINGIYSLTVTDANGCSNTASTTVVIYPLPLVDLGPDAAICAGSPVLLDADNIGSTFVWNTTATTQTISVSTPGTYYVTVTNPVGCSAADTINISTSGLLVPSVTITAVDTTICATTLASFTATPVNGGASPTFQWRKNGIAVGSIGPTYSTTLANNGDIITCRLTSSSSCAIPTQVFSDTIHMIVNPMFTPFVSITHLPDTACTGTPITFTANPINGGLSPFYQWKRAGSVVGTGSTYTYSPTFSEIVTVEMASSLTCHSIDTVSNTAGFIIYPALTPIITISTPATTDSIAYVGEVFNFNSTVTYGGTSPRFQWYMNRIAVPGATNNTFSRAVYTNDTFVCVVTSNAVCALPNKDTSNRIIIYGSFLGVNDMNTGKTAISIYPNPTTGDFTIKGLVGIKTNEEILIEIRDLKGTIVYRKFISAPNGQLNESLSLSNQLAEGLYMLRVHSNSVDKVTKIIIKK